MVRWGLCGRGGCGEGPSVVTALSLSGQLVEGGEERCLPVLPPFPVPALLCRSFLGLSELLRPFAEVAEVRQVAIQSHPKGDGVHLTLLHLIPVLHLQKGPHSTSQ